jgi:hypothetical protein
MPPKTYDSSTTSLKLPGGRSSLITAAPMAGPTAPKRTVVIAMAPKLLHGQPVGLESLPHISMKSARCFSSEDRSWGTRSTGR